MKIYVSGFIFIVILFSCRKVEKIELAGNLDPKLVVNCVLRADWPVIVYVNKSLSAIDNAQVKPISNALVLLYKDGKIKDTLIWFPSGQFYWGKSPKPIPGSEYLIKVSVPGLKAVEARASLPEQVQAEFKSLDVIEKNTDSFFIGSKWNYSGTYKSADLRFAFQDQAGMENYYMITVSGKWSGAGGNGNSYQWVCNNKNVELVETYNLSGNYSMMQYFFLTDALDDGKKIGLELQSAYSYNSFFIGEDSLQGFDITVYSLSEDYYKHLYTIKLSEQNTDNPFEEPVQIYSNVYGGYGIFGATSLMTVFAPFPY